MEVECIRGNAYVGFIQSLHQSGSKSYANPRMSQTGGAKRQILIPQYSLDNKALVPQLWTSSIRRSSFSGSLQQCLSSACSIWKTEREEAPRHEVEVERHGQGADDPATKPVGFGSSPPMAPVTILSRNSVASGAAGALRRPRCFVRRLLRELIASLPLLPADAKHAKKDNRESPIKMLKHVSTARSHSSPPPRPRRSLSVQTQACEGFQQHSGCETRPTKHRLSKNYRKSEDRWSGGVRALRDAHVRLVLCQLRHVERLNRALDRRAIGRLPAL